MTTKQNRVGARAAKHAACPLHTISVQPGATGNDRPLYPATISARTCLDAIGMSWAWCRRFAAANDVPCWRVGERKHLIPTVPLLVAMARVAASAEPAPELTDVERIAALRAELGLELRDQSPR